jgi:mitochondrial distribution and morphology protein 34
MDELPAIIHRLSLRLWCPEYRAREEEEMAQAVRKEEEEIVVDPFSSPPQDAVDSRGNVLDASEISSLSLDGGSEIHSLFSQKNLLRLAALTDSHRTLSLFTPSIRDAVFRAWAGPSERSDSAGSSTPATPSLLRSNSSLGTSTTYTFSRGSDDGHGHLPSRPSLVSMHSATSGLGLGAGRHSRSHMRKKKTRVVNLRKPKTIDDLVSESGDSEASSAAPVSEPILPIRMPEEPEDNIIDPPQSPQRVRFRDGNIELASPQKVRVQTRSTVPEQATLPTIEKSETVPIFTREPRPSLHSSSYPAEKAPITYTPAPILPTDPSAGSILSQAWVLKMANEIARRAQDIDEKGAREGFWSQAQLSQDEREDTPPPAYQAAM